MKSKSLVTDYRNSHTQVGKGAVYDCRLYAEDSAHTSLWHLESQYLSDLIERLVPGKNKYLDFACGTGRIIASFAECFNEADGIDISEPMLALARAKKLKAELIQGDITKDANIVGDGYDLITAFRFFLNAQDSLRREVITILAEKLAPDGILVFNIHNSKPSLLWLQNSFMNIFKTAKVKSMSRRQVNELLKDTPLQIVETTAFGIIPKAAHIILKPRLWRWLDRTLRKCRFLQNIGSDVIYVCRRRKGCT